MVKKLTSAKAPVSKPVEKKVAPKKKDLVIKYQSHKKDTGSVEVQVAQFSQKINQLSRHLKKHHKDNDSMRGLLQMIGKRRRLLNYLKRHNQTKYEELILDLGLRK
ncbi:MAG: small subunit ribosomal protein S15 [Candidatus Berkelbacteria bacterium Licking1014_7]|uniref:Small ribosomal subunit protein uS15 n=1 Tax=Candidatus Berkelbacteria bacterium Licking1014_7 TaxID=2017147 RepID=A0A554LI57_9BACT|nr:MAG: small subunit ribosomal protein S15 [Candidatus Berkelbacteria bacterium Licking1014_7]